MPKIIEKTEPNNYGGQREIADAYAPRRAFIHEPDIDTVFVGGPGDHHEEVVQHFGLDWKPKRMMGVIQQPVKVPRGMGVRETDTGHVRSVGIPKPTDQPVLEALSERFGVPVEGHNEMWRFANILDPIHEELSPQVFDDAASDTPKLKPQHLQWIVSSVYRVLDEHGYDGMDEWLRLVFTGSLTTYQYSNESDVDISLFVNVEKFPEWSRAEMIGVMVENMDGKTLPGTPHPMQCFVVPPDVDVTDLYKPGLRSGYDLKTNTWIVPPERDRAFDVQKEKNAAYVHALQQADKMERLLRYEPDKAVMFWHQLHGRRRRDHQAGKGDYSDSNIVYKFLFNRGLAPQIAEISGEYIAKIANRLGWRPGVYGKGLYNVDRDELHTWNEEPMTGDPHHEQYMYDVDHLNGDWDGETVYPLYIDENGRTESFTDADLSRLPEHDPRLTIAQEGEAWDEGSGEWKFADYNAPIGKRWAIDNLAIRRAADELGLTKPVKVEVAGGTHGYYRDTEDAHIIGVVGWLREEKANNQIWHELKHAQQSEQHDSLPERPEGHDDYRAMPTEVDARGFADRAPYPLVHPVKTAQNQITPNQAIEQAKQSHDLSKDDQISQQGSWTVVHEWWGPECVQAFPEEGWSQLDEYEREHRYEEELKNRQRSLEQAWGPIAHYEWEFRDDLEPYYDALGWTVHYPKPGKTAAPNKKARPARKFVYNALQDQLVIGELGPEEGALPNHFQLADQAGIDHVDHMGTINARGYVQFEGGSGDAKTRYMCEQALRKALPNEIAGFLGGETNNLWEFDLA